MKYAFTLIFLKLTLLSTLTTTVFAQGVKNVTSESPSKVEAPQIETNGEEERSSQELSREELIYEFSIFDDKMLLEGYTQQYEDLQRETLLAMIKDENLAPFKTAGAVRALKTNHIKEIPWKERRVYEKFLLRRLNRSNSPFVKVEIMHTLSIADRYRYFKSMVPALIQKMDHYNEAVNELSYLALKDILSKDQGRPREARLVFNTLRKVLFLMRKRLTEIDEPNERLSQKLDLVRWAIKILGNQELKRLPKEALSLL